MNIFASTLAGLKIEVVPLGTQIQTEEGLFTINDKTYCSDNSSIWMTENTWQTIIQVVPRCTGQDILGYIKSQSNYCPDVPEQSVIDSWPQLHRKPVLNADEIKHLENAEKAQGWVP